MQLFEWLTAVASLVGVVANIHHKRWCFWVWFTTGLCWTAVDLWHGIYAQATLQAVYAGLSVYGLRKWKGTR